MSAMRRVTKQNRCKICSHDSWCLEGTSVCVCMRVASDKPKPFRGGEVGWIHSLDGKVTPPYVKPAPLPPVINVGKILREYRSATSTRSIHMLAKMLGVSTDSLIDLEFLHSRWEEAWAVPMCDGHGNYIGIRIRHMDGRKWAEPGSHSGIFIPRCQPQSMALILEGPTDTAAALSLGFYGIGRPSCSGGVPHLVTAVKRLKIQRVVIVADNDDPGIRGATDLQKWLAVPSCMLVLPTKDLREFLRIGDKSIIASMIDQMVWTQPKEK